MPKAGRKGGSAPGRGVLPRFPGAVCMDEVVEAVELCLRAGLPPMLWGPPGVGKSATVEEVARRHGWGLVITRFADRNPVDVTGVPFPDVKKGRTYYLPPDEYPDPARDGEQGVWFLDEITNAPREVQTTLLGLFLGRRLSNYELPAGWHLVAAGNRVVDRAGSYQMTSSQANRMVHIPVCCSLPPLELVADGISVNFDQWRKWAYAHGIRGEVIAFHGFRQKLLWAATGQVAFATPRTWEFVSRILDAAEGRFVYLAVAGCVGDGPADEFAAFLRSQKGLLDPDGILAGHDVPVPPDPDTRWVLCLALVSRLAALKRKKNPGRMAAAVANLMKWLARMPSEFQVLCLKEAGRADLINEIAMDPGFCEFAQKHREVFWDDAA